MKIMILGIDGYLGWPLAQYLANRGHEVSGVDNFARRGWVIIMKSESAIPIVDPTTRWQAFKDNYGYGPIFDVFNIAERSDKLFAFMEGIKPDAIVHLAECPSAPFSMKSLAHASLVMRNNVIGTLNVLYAMKEFCPDAHLVKLGTMGEYGTPDVEIPEGFFTYHHKDRTATLPFPKQAGSWYHWTKVHDSNNIMFACQIWGLRSTDIMQGVVYGNKIDEMGDDPRLATRLDFDEAFGTVINRFVCQAVIGHPITVYGDVGKMRRGFLPLQDSMQCLALTIENPPEEGEYRVFNQFEDHYSIVGLANKVRQVALQMGIDADIRHFEPPRVESQNHYYRPVHEKLLALGYVPTTNMESVLRQMFFDLVPERERIEERKHVLIPKIFWDGSHHQAEFLNGE